MRDVNYLPLCSMHEHLDDPVALDVAYQRDGLLFMRGAARPGSELRGVLSRVLAEVAGVLTGWGIARGPTDLTWTGKPLPGYSAAELHDVPSLNELSLANASGHSPIKRLTDRIYGAPTETSGYMWLFISIPDSPDFTSPPHEDGLGRGGDNRRVWFPLTSIHDRDGGLAFGVASHHRGARPRVELPGYRMRDVRYLGASLGPNAVAKGVPIETVTEPWATSSFELGDAVMFHSHTMHAGIPTASNRIRVALSVFVTREGDNGWGQWAIPRRDECWRVATALAKKLGATDQEARVVAERLLHRETDPELATVESTLQEIRESQE